MIRFMGDIYENVSPNIHCPFIKCMKFWIFRLMVSCIPFEGNSCYLNQIMMIDIRPIYRRK